MTKPSFDLKKVKEDLKNFKFDKQTLKKMTPYFIEAVLFAFIIAFDLLMKDYLEKFLFTPPQSGEYNVFDGFFALYYSENTGAGFGMFKDGTMTLTIVTGIVIAAVIAYLIVYRHDSEGLRIPLIMISAGGIGNLVDRIELGYVRDFFEFTFMDFAIFNVADAFVTVGSIWLVIYLIYFIIKDTKKSKEKATNAAETDLSGDEDALLKDATTADEDNYVSDDNEIQSVKFEISADDDVSQPTVDNDDNNDDGFNVDADGNADKD